MKALDQTDFVFTSSTEIFTVFGKRVKAERNRCGITQEELAASIYVSDDTIKRIEQGGSVKLDVAYNITSALRVPIHSLLPGQNTSVDDMITGLQETIRYLEKRKTT